MTKAERYRRCEEGYQLELARSASHISSCMTEESTTRCIDEARPYRHFFPLGAPDRD